jgi:hypothetical protein
MTHLLPEHQQQLAMCIQRDHFQHGGTVAQRLTRTVVPVLAYANAPSRRRFQVPAERW